MGSLSLIPTEKITERLRYENPWWVNKQIPEVHSTMAKRLYFSLFYPFVIEKNVKKALATSIDRLGTKQIEDLTFSFLPASIYCYNIGVITLKMKNQN